MKYETQHILKNSAVELLGEFSEKLTELIWIQIIKIFCDMALKFSNKLPIHILQTSFKVSVCIHT